MPPDTDVTDTDEGNSEFKFSVDKADPDSGDTEEKAAWAVGIITKTEAHRDSPRAARMREPNVALPRVDISMGTPSAHADAS